jgi:ABC-type uncharacterized transport system ATPase subunit
VIERVEDRPLSQRRLERSHDCISTWPGLTVRRLAKGDLPFLAEAANELRLLAAEIWRPHIILLDEDTGVFDVLSERMVRHALEDGKEGKSIVVINGRLSRIENASASTSGLREN